MRHILILLFACIILSCADRSSETINYYPNKDFYKNEKLVGINLEEEYSNITSLMNRINQIYNKDSIPYIDFNIKDLKVNLVISQNPYGLISERNLLEITKDSIKGCHNVSIEKLDSILPEYYYNPREQLCNPVNPKRAAIDVSLKPKDNIETLKALLSKIILNFDKIRVKKNDTLDLYVTINYYNSILPPPPPEILKKAPQ